MKWTNDIRIVSATPASESTILIDWSDGSRRLFDAAPHMHGDFFDELGDPLYYAKLRIASHGETLTSTEPAASTQAKKMRPR